MNPHNYPRVLLGEHDSSFKRKSYLNELDAHRTLSYGCVQIFVDSTHKFATPKLFEKFVNMRDKLAMFNMQVVIHAAYTHNIVGMASKTKDDVLKERQIKNADGLRDALDISVLINGICKKCPEKGVVVVHPSSNGKNERTISNAVHVCRSALTQVSDLTKQVAEYLRTDVETIVSRRYLALEVCSGEGTKYGKTFEELRDIIFARSEDIKVEQCENYNKQIPNLGICLDTCHMFASGLYDMQNFPRVLEDIEKLGLSDLVYAIHLNDSKMPFNTKKDRHQTLGCGYIFNKLTKKNPGFMEFMEFCKTKHIPLILETPVKNRECDTKFLIDRL